VIDNQLRRRYVCRAQSPGARMPQPNGHATSRTMLASLKLVIRQGVLVMLGVAA
jgi:hypothetical protein